VLARKAIALESMTNSKNVSHIPQIVRKGTNKYLFDRTRTIFRDERPKNSRLGKLENFRGTHLKITTLSVRSSALPEPSSNPCQLELQVCQI
jgi:hypothetical protein